MTNNTLLQRTSNNMRILIAAMVEKAKSGHPGGAMGGIDFLTSLYADFLNWDPDDMRWFNRDRFFLDPGHQSPMLYAMLTIAGIFDVEDLKHFRQWGSILSGHPEMNPALGIENTSGPLGQGHVMGIGAAIAEKFLRYRFGDWMEHYTYAFISDGGIQEEISQGAGRIAGYLKLGNLIMFYDSNAVQLSTRVDEVTKEDTAKKYEAWGWHVQTINGNNENEINKALTNAKTEKERPSLIIGHTIMAKGCKGAKNENMEGLVATHGQPLSKAGIHVGNTIKSLGGDPENPFCIFDDVKKEWERILHEKRQQARLKKIVQQQWEKENPDKAKQLHNFIEGILPNIDFENIIQEDITSTRMASARVLAVLAEKIENMIVASADLSNSDKTDGFLNKTKPITPDDFSGRFLNIGVSELTMTAILNGILLHGGIRTAGGTFFVFSDYQKPAIRMAALQNLPAIFIWSHDSFRVGEDGPTHQPIEQYAEMQLLEQLKNHNGKNALLLFRPANGFEVNIAYKLALENKNSPTGIILTRQDIQSIPSNNNISKQELTKQIEKGAYIAYKEDEKPDLVLLGNGSEIKILFDALLLLKEKRDLKCNIVSAISLGLFENQSDEYKNKIIPNGIKVFALTAGLATPFEKYIKNGGAIYELNHFGFSAPMEVLEKEFGFTPDIISREIEKIL